MVKENYCSSCGREITRGELSVRCRLCLRNYHTRCWEQTRGCTTWGCAGKPAQGPPELKYRRCPYCGEDILDFAVKCSYCRTQLVQETRPADAHPRKSDRPRKDPILTCLLNLVFPGAGYMYLGNITKGLLWFLITLAAVYFARLLGFLAAYLWIMYDSTRQAVEMNKTASGERKNRSL